MERSVENAGRVLGTLGLTLSAPKIRLCVFSFRDAKLKVSIRAESRLKRRSGPSQCRDSRFFRPQKLNF